MSRTTPPRPLDVLAHIPELADHARPATRLHPRRGTPAVSESSIGGPLLWPADEPWPTCALPPYRRRVELVEAELAERLERGRQGRPGGRGRATPEENALHAEIRRARPGVAIGSRGGVWQLSWYESSPHPEPNALVGVAQLHAADIPTVAFPDGKDLLQILWCPLDHGDQGTHYVGPPVTLVWRRAAGIGAVLAEPPTPLEVENEYFLPKPCRIHPEQVIEYQYASLLPDPLRERLKNEDERWYAQHRLCYQYDLSIAPGTKAGGWASWHRTDPWRRRCADCGAGLDPLVHLADVEWDGIKTWKPVEDLNDGLNDGLSEDRSDDKEAQFPTGLLPGRGSLRIFTCSADPTHQHELDFQ